MNIQVISFQAAHIAQIVDGIIEPRFTREKWLEMAEFNERSSQALTAVINGNVVACAGVYSNGLLWSVFHRSVRNYLRDVVFTAKSFIDYLTGTMDVPAITAAVEPDFAAGHRFMEHLGFGKTGRTLDDGCIEYERVCNVDCADSDGGKRGSKCLQLA